MKKSSEKSFGILFFVVFLLIAIWPVLNGNSIKIWPIFIAVIFLIPALLFPKFLKPLNILWINLGELLGKIISPIVMLLIFFLILTPISLILKIFKKDLINLNLLQKKSYWIKRQKNVTSMDKQF